MSKTNKSFVHSFAIILILFAAGIILQHLPIANTFKFLLILLTTLPLCLVWTKLKTALTSYQFAIYLLVSILIGVMFGTFLIQNPSPDQTANVYGKFTGVIHFLFLDQLFQSWWFNLFLALMAISLALVLIKRKPFRATQAGFLFSHTGVILILLGGLIGRIFGTEGFIELQEGKSASVFQIISNGNVTDSKDDLGFQFKLDDFQVDFYDAKYKIYAYSFDRSIQDYRSVGSYEIDKSKTEKIPGTNTVFEIASIEKTKYVETGHNRKGRHYLAYQASDPREIEIGKTYSLGPHEQIEVLEFLPHFAYDIDQRRAINVSEYPKNPAILVRVQGTAEMREQWLFANMPDFYQKHEHTKQKQVAPLIYSYTLPSCCNKEVPLLTLLLKSPAGVTEEKLTYNPEKPLFLEDGNVALVIDKRDGDVKEYRSVASIIEQSRTVQKATIAVNHPLKYAGFSFYQSNYRPDDLTYSGFHVVKDPGLAVVYTGAGILCFGVIWIFYITPSLIRARRRKEEEVKNVSG